MTARLDHKRGNTLRWLCRRTTDPKPGSGEDPAALSIVGFSVGVTIRNDVLSFSQDLTVMTAAQTASWFGSQFTPESGYFGVYFAGNAQSEWPLGDIEFDFLFKNLSAPNDLDRTETAIMHLVKENTVSATTEFPSS